MIQSLLHKKKLTNRVKQRFIESTYCAKNKKKTVYGTKIYQNYKQSSDPPALPGFNDLGRSVTLIFLLMDHFLLP